MLDLNQPGIKEKVIKADGMSDINGVYTPTTSERVGADFNEPAFSEDLEYVSIVHADLLDRKHSP